MYLYTPKPHTTTHKDVYLLSANKNLNILHIFGKSSVSEMCYEKPPLATSLLLFLDEPSSPCALN